MIQVENQAEICPVYHGSGKYKETYNMNYIYATYIEKTCHCCEGKDWVIVPQTKDIQWSSFFSSTGEPQTFNMEKAIEEHVPKIM